MSRENSDADSPEPDDDSGDDDGLTPADASDGAGLEKQGSADSLDDLSDDRSDESGPGEDKASAASAARPAEGPVSAAAKRESLMQELRRASQDFKKLMHSDGTDSDEALSPAGEKRAVKQDSEKVKAIQATLEPMSVKELKAKAHTMGITDEELDEAEEAAEPKKAIIELIIDEQLELDEEHDALQAELESKSISELKTRARKDGLQEREIEAAEEKDNPKQALISLILADEEDFSSSDEMLAREKDGQGAKAAPKKEESSSPSTMIKATSYNPMLRKQAEEKKRQEKEAEAHAKLRAQIKAEGFDGIPDAGEERIAAHKQAKKEREARRAEKEKAKAREARAKRRGKSPAKKGTGGDAKEPPPVIPGQGLLITLDQAKGLRNADKNPGDMSDPFCTCEIPRKPKSRIESHVVMNDLSPVWNYTRQIVEYTENDTLRFCVWEKDFQTKQLLGKCELKFAQYHPDGFEQWIQMPTTLKPIPELLVKVEILGPPASARSDKEESKKLKKKRGKSVQYEFGRRVPRHHAPLSPRAQARFDARRLVDSFDCWCENLRGSDEFTQLIPSKAKKKPQSTKAVLELPPEAEIAFSTFKYFLLQRAGNYSRAWRILLDSDWSGKLTLLELCNKCRENGYNGNVSALWKAIDRTKRGWATLADIDTDTAESLGRFYMALETRRRVEEQGRRSAGHVRDAEEPESEPGHGGTSEDGVRLMKCLDVDATRRLTKGEFCCAVQVLQLAKEEHAPVLFDMLCQATAAHTPSSAVVTEDELQWLHNVFEPFNLFEKPSRHGKTTETTPEKGPKLLSAAEREEASQVSETKGRLRKVWSQDPAVFGRLYDDFERREDDYFLRVTEEPDTGKETKPAREVEEVSTRLYEDAFIRSAKRDLEAEGFYKLPASQRPMDPEVQSRLTAPKKTPQLTKRQKAEEEALRKEKQNKPKRKVNYARIDEMLQDHRVRREKKKDMAEEHKRKMLLKEIEYMERPREFKSKRKKKKKKEEMPEEEPLEEEEKRAKEENRKLTPEEMKLIKARQKRKMLAAKQIERMEAKLREEAEDEGLEFGAIDEEEEREKREHLQAIEKILHAKKEGGGGSSSEDEHRKSALMAGLVKKKEKEAQIQKESVKALQELARDMRPQAPLPIPRKDGTVPEIEICPVTGHHVAASVGIKSAAEYPYARTPRWIAKNELRRARSAGRSHSPATPRTRRQHQQQHDRHDHHEHHHHEHTPSPPRNELPEGPAHSAADLTEALPLTQEDHRQETVEPSISRIRVFPMPKKADEPPLTEWEVSDDEPAAIVITDEMLDSGQDPLAKLKKRKPAAASKGASGSKKSHQQGKGKGASGAPTPHQQGKGKGASVAPTPPSVGVPPHPVPLQQAKAKGKGYFDQPEKPVVPQQHAAVSSTSPVTREDLVHRTSQSATPPKSTTPQKATAPEKSARSSVAKAAHQSSSEQPAATSAVTASAAPAAAETPAAPKAPEAPAAPAVGAAAAATGEPTATTTPAGPPTRGRDSTARRGSTPQARAKTPPGRQSLATQQSRPSRDATPPPARRGSGSAAPPAKRGSSSAAPPPAKQGSNASAAAGRDATPPPAKRGSSSAAPPRSSTSAAPGRDATPPPAKRGSSSAAPPPAKKGSITGTAPVRDATPPPAKRTSGSAGSAPSA